MGVTRVVGSLDLVHVVLVGVSVESANGGVNEEVGQVEGVGESNDLLSSLAAQLVDQSGDLVHLGRLEAALPKEETRVLLDGPDGKEVGKNSKVGLDSGLGLGDSSVERGDQMLSGVDSRTLKSLLRQLLKGLVRRQTLLGELDEGVSGSVDGLAGNLLPCSDEHSRVSERLVVNSGILQLVSSLQVLDRLADMALLLSHGNARLDERSTHGQTQHVVVTLPSALDDPVGVSLTETVVAG